MPRPISGADGSHRSPVGVPSSAATRTNRLADRAFQKNLGENPRLLSHRNITREESPDASTFNWVFGFKKGDHLRNIARVFLVVVGVGFITVLTTLVIDEIREKLKNSESRNKQETKQVGIPQSKKEKMHLPKTDREKIIQSRIEELQKSIDDFDAPPRVKAFLLKNLDRIKEGDRSITPSNIEGMIRKFSKGKELVAIVKDAGIDFSDIPINSIESEYDTFFINQDDNWKKLDKFIRVVGDLHGSEKLPVIFRSISDIEKGSLEEFIEFIQQFQTLDRDSDRSAYFVMKDGDYEKISSAERFFNEVKTYKPARSIKEYTDILESSCQTTFVHDLDDIQQELARKGYDIEDLPQPSQFTGEIQIGERSYPPPLMITIVLNGSGDSIAYVAKHFPEEEFPILIERSENGVIRGYYISKEELPSKTLKTPEEIEQFLERRESFPIRKKD